MTPWFKGNIPLKKSVILRYPVSMLYFQGVTSLKEPLILETNILSEMFRFSRKGFCNSSWWLVG